MILQGKTVLVTGVGGGLGRECAASALRDGANVVIAARTADSLAAIAAELDPTGGRVASQVTDITDADSCAALVDLAKERFGTVVALVPVAAISAIRPAIVLPTPGSFCNSSAAMRSATGAAFSTADAARS